MRWAFISLHTYLHDSEKIIHHLFTLINQTREKKKEKEKKKRRRWRRVEKKKGGGGEEGWTCTIERETFIRGVFVFVHSL